MPEELRNDSMTDRTIREGGVEAWERAQELMDLDVFDVNGTRVGRVTKCFAEEGRLVSCQVTVDETVRREFDFPDDVATFDSAWISEVSSSGVRIEKAAAQVVGKRLPTGARGAGGTSPQPAEGSDTFPRKTR